MVYEHQCIKPKCGAVYKDDDEDPYYCSPCREENKKIAVQLDKKFANRTPQQKSDWEAFQEKAKTVPSPNGGFRTFGNAKDFL